MTMATTSCVIMLAGEPENENERQRERERRGEGEREREGGGTHRGMKSRIHRQVIGLCTPVTWEEGNTSCVPGFTPNGRGRHEYSTFPGMCSTSHHKPEKMGCSHCS